MLWVVLPLVLEALESLGVLVLEALESLGVLVLEALKRLWWLVLEAFEYPSVLLLMLEEELWAFSGGEL